MEHEEQAPVDEAEVETPAADDGDGEGEGGEGEGGAEAEEEPAPPASSGWTHEQQEARAQAADKAYATYSRAVSRIYESDADALYQCPLCASSPYGFIHPDDIGRQPEETKATVKAMMGVTQRPQYRPSPTTSRCEVCDGWGKLDTDSRLELYADEVCGHCGGTGRYPPPGHRPNGDGSLTGEQAAVLVGGDEPIREDVDPWGSPLRLDSGADNPNYGKMPQYKDPRLP